MARATISDLQAKLDERDAQIARLQVMLDETARSLFEVKAAMRLLGTIVRDVNGE